METILDKIIRDKYLDIKNNQAYYDDLQPIESKQTAKFAKAMTKTSLSIIAEVKRGSPSKGRLASISEPVVLVNDYIKAGVDALSVLTEQHYFFGSNHDLQQVADNVTHKNIPVLRKDFIVDVRQLIEAKLLGADAILLIVKVLGEKTVNYINAAARCGLEALVEVHDRQELSIALEAGATIIGINNRDLNSFATDINVSLELGQHIPDGVIKISESGIKTPQHIRCLEQAGFDGVLIGESLVTSNDIFQTIRTLRGVA